MSKPTFLSASAIALVLAVHVPAADAARPRCGDGVGQKKEDCDGADLRGGSCQSLGYDGGTLGCNSDCTYDVGQCTTAPVDVCGDNEATGYEECDGTDDAACDGLCSAHCACPATGTGALEIHFIDVGQGDAILVISPDGFVTLVDSGTDGASTAVAGYMTSLGIVELDYTVVSHMDADHVGGMDHAINAFDPVVCFDHGGGVGTAQYTEYDTAAGSRRLRVEASDSIDMGPSMQVDVLHGHAGSSLENDNSVVLRLRYGANVFLLGGDCEEACESSFDPGVVDVYKVHHHGSSTSTTIELLDKMQAYTGVISVGAGNQYAHPSQQTLDRLAAYDVPVFRTDDNGDIAIVSDGVGYTINGLPVCAAAATRTCGESDVGECSYGQRACIDGMWDAVCAGEVSPVLEVCDNAIDDDCDGTTDLADADCAPTASYPLLCQVSYDTPGTDSVEEFVDICNPTSAAISLDGWSLSDNAATWSFPAGTTVEAGGYLTVARNAAGFRALYGLDPDASGLSLALGNTGDTLVLANGVDEVDHVAWEDFEPGWSIAAPTGASLERIDHATDSDTVGDWFVRTPATPLGGTIANEYCGDGTCQAGEDCNTCPADCVGVTGGRPSGRYCCGNGTCEPVGEDAAICPLDCP